MRREQVSNGQVAVAWLDERRARLVGAVAVSTTLSLAVVMSSLGVESRLGVPQWWPWVLTGIQVTALWAAGSKKWWGWLLGSAAQPAWIVYALLTGQLGFIPGCTISAAVQTYSYWTGSAPGDGRGHVAD